MDSPPRDDYPVLLDLKTKKTYPLTKRTLKIGWGEYDIELNDENCKGLCCEIMNQNNAAIIFPFAITTSCLVNDVEIEEQTTLTHGCTLQLGKSSLFRFEETRFKSNRNSVLDESDLTDGASPPPKPPRLYSSPCSSIDKSSEDGMESTTSGANSFSDDWCIIIQPDIDSDLIQQLQTPEQVAHLASSYISRQLLMLTNVSISPELVDEVFKAMQEVAETNENILIDFLKTFCEDNNKLKEKEDIETESTSGKPKFSCHIPLIKLLLDLLRYSLDPVEHNILWTKLLAKLSFFTENHHTLLTCRAGAVLLGTMAAHLQADEIQENACHVLAQLAKYKPTPNAKGAVKQCAIELVVTGMERHLDKPSVLRPACKVLANTVVTTSEVTAMTPQQEGFNIDVFEKMMVASLEMIDYIRDVALPVLESAMHEYPKDFSINFDGAQVKEYFKNPSKFKKKKQMEKDEIQKEAAKNLALEAIKQKKKVTKVSKTHHKEATTKHNDKSPSSLMLPISEREMKLELNMVGQGTLNENDSVLTGTNGIEAMYGETNSSDYNANVNYSKPQRQTWEKSQSCDLLVVMSDIVRTPNSTPEMKRERKKWSTMQVLPVGLITEDTNTPKIQPKSCNTSKKFTKNHSEVINFLGTLWITGNQVQAIESLTRTTEEIIKSMTAKKKSTCPLSTADKCLIDTDPTVCASALNVFCSHKAKWTLAAAAKVLPLTEILFANRLLMRPAAEVITLILSLYGQDVLKQYEAIEYGCPSPFHRDDRHNLDVCYEELGKVHDQIDGAISRVNGSIESQDLIRRLETLQTQMQEFTSVISLA
ncbi:uncharacterized protein LOC100377809 [Saccoglossus kowalevskii]|uniref:Uncharacterized protein LOC100377809 n=1 Tax=Saccoglossus kowalevskii TaxID=10224 RepID=A0ABM0LV27_SACKO|nr:PREDICTED: uncharacterized protein LOC100377809 [Saccoglossus kowalevskii]